MRDFIWTLLLLLLSLASLVSSACSNCERAVNDFCCRTAWHGMCCEFPINQARSSRSRYRPEPVMSSMGNQLGSLRRLRRRQHRRKEGGNRITKLESRLLAAILEKMEKKK